MPAPIVAPMNWEPVSEHCLAVHAACDEGAEADRRVHMAAGDVADAIGHGHDGQAKSKSNSKLSDLVAGQNGRTATKQDKSQSADQFGCKDFHDFPPRNGAAPRRLPANLMQFPILGN